MGESGEKEGRMDRMRIRSGWRRAVLSGLLLLGVGCASIPSEYDPPSLELVSIVSVPTDDLAQRFRLGFLLRNPNGEQLSARGMSYSVYLEGHKLLSGVTDDVPVVGPYQEQRFEIVASTSLLGSLRLINDLIQQPRSQVEYRLQVKIDVTSPLHRALRLEEAGQIQLSQ